MNVRIRAWRRRALGALLVESAGRVERVADRWPPAWADALTAPERRDVLRVAARLRALGGHLGADPTR